jgi:hypothetical protein
MEDKQQIGDVENAHSLLRAVYHNTALDLSVRMRAASMAIAYEMPKLMAVAQVTENDLATLLDRRIKRLQEMEAGRLIEARPQPTAVEVKPPMPRLADRRYRRL